MTSVPLRFSFAPPRGTQITRQTGESQESLLSGSTAVGAEPQYPAQVVERVPHRADITPVRSPSPDWHQQISTVRRPAQPTHPVAQSAKRWAIRGMGVGLVTGAAVTAAILFGVKHANVNPQGEQADALAPLVNVKVLMLLITAGATAGMLLGGPIGLGFGYAVGAAIRSRRATATTRELQSDIELLDLREPDAAHLV